MILDSKGNFKSFNIPSYTYKIPYDYGITREEVRKVWEVTICYDYNKYKENGPERFVYYVDATTGEIIGGNRFYGAKMQKNIKKVH